MAFTADEIANINNAVLKTYLDRGTVFKQNVQNKPMLQAFDTGAGKFPGGKEVVSLAVKAGQGGLILAGYSGDDQVNYGNPTGIKRAEYPWKEHHIGMVVTHTELKEDGIDVDDESADQSTSEMDGREAQALANLLEEKMDSMGEDYAKAMDLLIHRDGTADPKALAGIQSIILDNPGTGVTGTVDRIANPWWRNRAATAAYGGAGGQGAITVSATGGGALIAFLEKEWRQLGRYAQGSPSWNIFAGSDFIAGYLSELRANGWYTNVGWTGGKTPDGGIDNPKFKGVDIVYDPTLDDMSLSKRAYVIDMSKRGLRLMYMNGQRMKKHNPARPYDRYVMYNGLTTTAVIAARQLNTSAVYDIA